MCGSQWHRKHRTQGSEKELLILNYQQLLDANVTQSVEKVEAGFHLLFPKNIKLQTSSSVLGAAEQWSSEGATFSHDMLSFVRHTDASKEFYRDMQTRYHCQHRDWRRDRRQQRTDIWSV